MAEFTGNIPKPADLMATLINLLAEQEGCKILYTVSDTDGNIRSNRKGNANENIELI